MNARLYTAHSVGEENWIFSLPEEPLLQAYRRYREGKVLEAAEILGHLKGLGYRYENHHVPEAFFDTHEEGWARLEAPPATPAWERGASEKRSLRAHLALRSDLPEEVMAVGLEVLNRDHVEKVFLVHFHPETLHPSEEDKETLTR